MVRPVESEPALIGPVALVFILLGGFLATWGGMWFSYENHQPNSNQGTYYVCVGLMTTGIALIAIGLGMGRMALVTRSEARKAQRVDDQPIGREL